MANILMIEPNYKCKYPPLGLMKISYYHKEVRNDNVWFSKGELSDSISENVIEKLRKSKYYCDKYGDNLDEFIDNMNDVIKNKRWDRVYVCTLFTFEYEETLKAIDYAKSLVGKENVYTGGILATLMTKQLREDTGVVVNTGQLTDSKDIGYDDKYNIDIVTPDYSILDNTEYKYENEDAYYAYTTRGCGMNCGFCAVKTLEPEYKSFISIKDQINNVNSLYGPKKDLLLMDNNVLKSRDLDKIINEIIELGFHRDATYINPKTNKTKRRFVDFNQGLDAFLMTEEKAKLLGKIAIRPARIAFDHIEDQEVYKKAIRVVATNGVRYLSNYLLYNADDFSGKGRHYKADGPEDLYNRLRINVELQEELNKDITDDNERISIFSFPMRYIPLDDEKRGYVGKRWTKKSLRAVQSILIPTQGKGVSGKSFFDTAFGKSVDEFLQTILMPEAYIVTRGNPNKIKNITEEELENKLKVFNRFSDKRNEWIHLYEGMNDVEREQFNEVIGINRYNYFSFNQLTSDIQKKLYIHYLSESSLMSVLEKLYLHNNMNDVNLIVTYIKNTFYYKYEELVEYMVNKNKMLPKLQMFKYIFEDEGKKQLIDFWVKESCSNDSFITNYSKVFDVPLQYLYILRWCKSLNINIDYKEAVYQIFNDGNEYFNSYLDMIMEFLKDNYSEKESKEMIGELRQETAVQLGFSLD